MAESGHEYKDKEGGRKWKEKREQLNQLQREMVKQNSDHCFLFDWSVHISYSGYYNNNANHTFQGMWDSDHGHYSKSGYEYMGEKMYEFILVEGLLNLVGRKKEWIEEDKAEREKKEKGADSQNTGEEEKGGS